MIRQMDAEALNEFLAQAERAGAQVPPESQDMTAAILGFVRQRLEEVGGDR